MPDVTDLKAPYPYFGGKRRAAPRIWARLGDPSGYVEPFAGSAAVLLARPAYKGRRVETINDADGWLINAWRAIRHEPATVAEYAYGPVSEIDYHARLAWLHSRRDESLMTWLEGHPEAYDAKAAGWWLYVLACGIGEPFSGGPWVVHDGHLVNRRDHDLSSEGGVHRALPHLGCAGRGIARGNQPGVSREIPHLGDAGQGVARTPPGVGRELPNLGNAGQGVTRSFGHADTPTLTGLIDYMTVLSQRLDRVRITAGDWRRVTSPAVLNATAGGDGARAMLLDPPYTTSGDLYAHGDTEISHDVRAWCLTPEAAAMRVVLTGYDHEHDELLAHGWTVSEGKSGSGSGYSARKDNGRRERLWSSPRCLKPDRQDELFAMEDL